MMRLIRSSSTRAVVVACAVACAWRVAPSLAETFARSRNGAEFDAGDVVACSGAPVREMVVGRVMCVRQMIDASALPRIGVEYLTADVRVWVNEESQLVRGEPRITTDGVTFSFVPTTNGTNGTLTVVSTIEPKSRVIAGYYDVAWYELSVVWPTFFSSTRVEPEDEEDEEITATVDFNPFPCTWFLGADYLCNSTTWMSG